MEDSYDAALKAADALFSPRAPEAPAGSTAPTRLDAATETGGRILRAIEQEPPEARHAPTPSPERVMKRRGRKPGSKNKPKPAPVPRLDISMTTKAGSGLTAARRAVPGADLIAPVSATKPQPRSTARTRREPFAWVRTKLRPGENWKRRLPKVVW